MQLVHAVGLVLALILCKKKNKKKTRQTSRFFCMVLGNKASRAFHLQDEA